MKTFSIFLLTMSTALGLPASENKYIETMKKTINEIYVAETQNDLQRSINTMERIAVAEKDKWEPQYYVGYGYIMMSFYSTEAAGKDQYLDRAMEAIGKAKEIADTESEVAALEGFAQMIRLTVDPATRGQQYSQRAFDAFGKALALNPDNPRALALLAQMQLGTARFFNSSPEESCRTLVKALEKFKTYQPENELAPSWGLKMAESMKADCQ